MRNPESNSWQAGLLWLDHALARVTLAAAILVVPLALLLCAQWPLRDWFGAYSREANDLAQLLFGLYVSIGVTKATRDRSHLTPDVVAQRYPPRARAQLMKFASVAIVLPWTIFILYSSTALFWQSVREMESFPDTGNPGYFLLKVSIWLLALLAMAQALVDVCLPAPANIADGIQ